MKTESAEPRGGGSRCRFVVLTGGPGAGKTALLEIVRRTLCRHVAILPESASILFGGGFWRRPGREARKAAQRAIYHVQNEQQRLVDGEPELTFALCDRGTIDGLAYWPEPPESFYSELLTSRAAELARYSAVIHLRTPSAQQGYNHQNPLRTEDPAEAHEIDERILAAWAGHPQLYIVDSCDSFLRKAERTIEILNRLLPTCCPRSGLSARATAL